MWLCSIIQIHLSIKVTFVNGCILLQSVEKHIHDGIYHLPPYISNNMRENPIPGVNCTDLSGGIDQY